MTKPLTSAEILALPIWRSFEMIVTTQPNGRLLHTPKMKQTKARFRHEREPILVADQNGDHWRVVECAETGALFRELD